jgi:hypothetical protein
VLGPGLAAGGRKSSGFFFKQNQQASGVNIPGYKHHEIPRESAIAVVPPQFMQNMVAGAGMIPAAHMMQNLGQHQGAHMAMGGVAGQPMGIVAMMPQPVAMVMPQAMMAAGSNFRPRDAREGTGDVTPIQQHALPGPEQEGQAGEQQHNQRLQAAQQAPPPAHMSLLRRLIQEVKKNAEEKRWRGPPAPVHSRYENFPPYMNISPFGKPMNAVAA